MALSALAFSAMNVLVKLAGARLPTQEIVFVRALVSLAISLALLRRAGIHGLGTRRGLLLLRGLWGYAALSCVFYAVSHLPLAEATMIQYLHPTLTALLAALVLGERGDRALAASLALGSAGVALVVRPALLFGGAAAPLEPGAVAAALAGAALTAVAYVGVRELSRSEHPLVIVVWFPLVAAPAALPATLAHGLWPTAVEWALLAGIGVLAQLGQMWLTRGLALETAGRATALSYLQIAFAVGWGWLFFAELPGPWTAAGAALIAAGTWIGARATGQAAARVPPNEEIAGPSPIERIEGPSRQ
jgi:drug/metabolite transporter (DMT)-like permease